MGWFVRCPEVVTQLEGENTNPEKRPTLRDTVPIKGLGANFLVLAFQVLVGPGPSWLALITLSWSQDIWGWPWNA